MAENKKYDLIVIGSGPGGYVAAVHAARLGMKTACIERHSRPGGVCLNVGCIPSKALLDSSEFYHLAKETSEAHGVMIKDVELDLSAMMKRKEKVVQDLTDGVRGLFKQNDVAFLKGAARVLSPDQVEIRNGEDKETYMAKNILLATGSKPVEVQEMKFDGERIISSTEALSLESTPKHLGIVGAGYIGLELGSVWRRLGAEVTVLEMLKGIATNMDGQTARRLQRILAKQGLNFRLKTKVLSAEVSEDIVKVTVEKDGKEDSLEFDRLLVAVGRKPLTEDLGLADVGVKIDENTGCVVVDDQYRTNVSSIYAIGDLVAGPMLAHKASAEGVAAVECMTGQAGEVNYDAIPYIIYTWPEAASVGITEERAKELEVPYSSATYPFTGNGRARCMGETDGFVKILAHKKTDRVLGIHILGPRASDMIAECVIAIEFGASAEDLARTIHGHPTLSETLQEAAGMISH